MRLPKWLLSLVVALCVVLKVSAQVEAEEEDEEVEEVVSEDAGAPMGGPGGAAQQMSAEDEVRLGTKILTALLEPQYFCNLRRRPLRGCCKRDISDNHDKIGCWKFDRGRMPLRGAS